MIRLGAGRQGDDNPASFPNGGGMTWVDLAVFGFLLISGLLAFVRGLVREVLGIAAWIGSLALAFFALPTMRGMVRNWIPQPEWVDPASFIVVFIVALIILTLIARAIGGAVRRSALGGVDRTLGLVFGLLRGAAVVIVAYIIGQMVFPIERWPDVVLNARTLTPTYQAARWVREQIPESYRPHAIEPPPAGRSATAEALLRASPQGRATGKNPERE
jgi:membrane protein required for colicin V production